MAGLAAKLCQAVSCEKVFKKTQEAKTSSTALQVIDRPGFNSGTYDLVTVGMQQSMLHSLAGNLVTKDT